MSPSRLTVEAWPMTDAGGMDADNQDDVLVYQPTDQTEVRLSGSIYIVADGSGTGEQARIASSYAVKQVAYLYYSDDEPDLGLRLRRAVEQVNRDLYEYAQSRPELVKLSTTLTAAVIRGEQVHVASVGDSRAYLIRDGSVQRITRDHTLVQQLVEEGAISPEEANDHPRRDVVLRMLGADQEVSVDVYDLRLKPDDALLLATDGLTRRLSDDDIETVVARQSPRNAADSLIQRAKLQGGEENTTVITALARDGGPPLATDVPHKWDRRPATFTDNPTMPLPMRGGAASDLEDDIPEDATTEMQATQPLPTRPSSLPPTPPPPPDATQAAPPYQQQAQPAPQYQGGTQPAPGYGQQQPPPGGYQPPPGYQPYQGEVDPVTGLPPVPGQQGQQPYPQQGYQQQPPAQPPQPPPPGYPQYGPRGYDPNQSGQRRGIPVGLFAAVGLVTVFIVVGLIFLLLNPFGWELPSLAGDDGETPIAETDGGDDEPGAGAGGGGDGTAVETEVVTEESTGPEEPTEPPAPTATIAPAATATQAAPPGMVLVDGGAFQRGATEEEVQDAVLNCIDEDPSENNVNCLREFFTDAQPVEEVTLSDFFIDVFEVTNAAYAQCVGAGVCTPPGDTTFYDDPAFANHPVTYVDWNQSVTYCEFLRKRLPTEAEWEMAARWDPLLNESRVYPWDNVYEPGIANTLTLNRGGTAPVTDFERDVSYWGIRQMSGNVSEWVQDWYVPSYEGLGTLNPTGPEAQPLAQPIKVVRGGSFLEFPSRSRASHRFTVNIATQQPWLGFRCAADANADVGAPEVQVPTPEPADVTPTVDPAATTPPEGETGGTTDTGTTDGGADAPTATPATDTDTGGDTGGTDG